MVTNDFRVVLKKLSSPFLVNMMCCELGFASSNADRLSKLPNYPSYDLRTNVDLPV